MDLITLLELLTVLPVLYLLWFFCVTDRDHLLALAEKFGLPVSVYRGKVVWITGASSGLGKAFALELASVGAKLVFTARNKIRLAEVKEECLEIAQGKLDDQDILVLPFDVTDYDVHKTNVNDVLNHFGQIDFLVNNAGMFQVGRAENTDLEVVKALFDVNVFAAINLTKEVLKHFRDRGTGDILVISSTAAKFANPGLSLYSSTKSALLGYYHALRVECHSDNINVTMVCPSFFKSEIGSKIMGTKKGQVIQTAYPCPCEMETSRCAHLSLVAAANKLPEVWIAFQPFLFLIWSAQHFSDLFSYVASAFCTKHTTDEICEGKYPSTFPVWKQFL